MNQYKGDGMRNILIGVDGGGTKTNFIAIDANNGQAIATASAGSIHVGTMGLETAISNLKEGINALRLSREDTVLALSIGDPAIDDTTPLAGESLREIGRQLLGEGGRCFSKSDVFMALYAFSLGTPAALLVAGTGSMGVGMKTPYQHGTDNTVFTVGGWGDPTCDPGSGYWIAVNGICAAINAFDGIAPQTALCQRILPFFGVTEPRKLIDIFNGDTPRNQIAAFSKEVDICAQEGDAVSLEILEKAGALLARYACQLLKGMENPKIGVYGSVLLCSEIVRQVFEQQVKIAYPTVKIEKPNLPPEYGAAVYGADALGIDRRNWL